MYTEIDYTLAHNIIYAGHDFAAEFEINPHKEFATTRFILEEDDDKVPLIEIETGDEDGNPYLMVDKSYNYGPALSKLEKNAGEGNYSFYINDEDDFDDENQEDMDDDAFLDDIEPDYIDFNNIVPALDEELEVELENENRTIADLILLRAELNIRYREDLFADKMVEIAKETTEYNRYEEAIELHTNAFNQCKDMLGSLVNDLNSFDGEKMPVKNSEDSDFYLLFTKYITNELCAHSFLNSVPTAHTLLHLELLQKNIDEYPPLVQLTIAAFSYGYQKKLLPVFENLPRCKDVQELFPTRVGLHAMHHKLFWLLKAIEAIDNEDLQQLLHYHSLLRITGVGGRLKQCYALRINERLDEGTEGEDETEEENEP
ncbi:hypothetical protein [Foetidibacter luteolus]|uniref:hypothetical protein n=1 Tax=Foetidibacter luteolus TaxID=2608880 RepID=UPI00129A9857|nr:hypothetical protein [Foetidibacter luteolus]